MRGEAGRLVSVLRNCKKTNWHLVAQSSISLIPHQGHNPACNEGQHCQAHTGWRCSREFPKPLGKVQSWYRTQPGCACFAMQPASCARTAKNCTPRPASNAHADFWGALLAVCERSAALGHCVDPARNLVLLSLGWHPPWRILLPAVAAAPYQHLWHLPVPACCIIDMVVSKPYSPTSRSPRKRKGITLWVAGSTGWPHTLLVNCSLCQTGANYSFFV